MRVQEWRSKFGSVPGGKEIVALTGEASADLRLLEKGDVIICTPSQWDVLSRRWRQRKNVQTVALLIADEVHLTELKTRIVALGVSLANARGLGEWIGLPSHAIFNFSPSARPPDMDIHLQSFSIPHFPSLMLAMSKPAYLDNLLLHAAAAEEQADRFLHVEAEDLEVHLAHLTDEGLKETLRHGIGYFHEALSKQDRRIVQRLFESGAVQVLVASKDTAWSLPVSSYMTIIMGVQYYEGEEHRYIDYPVMDVLQIIGRACRPREDERSRCVLMCQQPKKDFYKKFLAEGLPIESHLTAMLHDSYLAEIAVKTIENKQDAMDILTWTYFYRRMTQNPNYYNLHNVSHQHLSEHLSELVETTLSQLMNSKCIAIEEESNEVSSLNLGMIAAYYNISYVTVEVYTLSLKERTKLRGLLEVVSSSAEFEIVPIRRHEDTLLRLPVKLDASSVNYESPHFKTFLLLQAHFSRVQLPVDSLQTKGSSLKSAMDLALNLATTKALTVADSSRPTRAFVLPQSPIRATLSHRAYLDFPLTNIRISHSPTIYLILLQTPLPSLMALLPPNIVINVKRPYSKLSRVWRKRINRGISPADGSGWIYIIYRGGGVFKVGRTRDLRRRMREWRWHCPGVLNIFLGAFWTPFTHRAGNIGGFS
ncbi:hypothetical protein D9757_014974 [Collybiopsis confluens]|uniref:SEC63 domain-containing protein n=1 Tax=Collybiopsis confluens TaxID=2823264 RepID=A0A8H5CJK5_9AGAR|nr:hypothetical protein D9757_014974 [Collybiopsis confluens]